MPHQRLRRLLAADDVSSALARYVPVVLVNISRSGCLLEAATRLEAGTVGLLHLTIAEETCSDDARVVRCQRIEGAGERHHLGVEFLWTSQPDRQSLRRLVTRLRGAVPQPVYGQFDIRQA